MMPNGPRAGCLKHEAVDVAWFINLSGWIEGGRRCRLRLCAPLPQARRGGLRHSNSFFSDGQSSARHHAGVMLPEDHPTTKTSRRWWRHYAGGAEKHDLTSVSGYRVRAGCSEIVPVVMG